MKNILLIHGANLNLLGRRDKNLYGVITLAELVNLVENEAKRYEASVISYQSNHEGGVIDTLQEMASVSCGIIINPGAFSHYSYAIHDALVDTTLPVIEVHLSDIMQREAWRQHSVIAPACIKTISGKKEKGYQEAVCFLMDHVGSP